MAQIELKEFIESVLVQVAQGVREANNQLKSPDQNQYEVFCLRNNKGDSSKIPGVKFDVAITAESGQKDKAAFFVALANIGGAASTEKSKGDELIHRIQFEVGVENTWR